MKFLILLFSFAANASTPIWEKPIPLSILSFDTVTPLFEAQQVYLEAAPRGVGAKNVWSLPGGTGSRVKIVDVESCFEDQHEDFSVPFYLGNNPKSDCQGADHGTAVWGVVAAKKDEKGVTGIAHGAQFGIYGFLEGDLDKVDEKYVTGINTAIRDAMDRLSAGDVLIIEQHMLGPDNYTAVEYWQPIFDQLKAATDRGIICIEAAGNGGSNLDSPKYNGAFDLRNRDSGCILVGAGGGDMNRLSFSNYGSRIDAFGYGINVTTTAYGDLFNAGATRMYTQRFNGTSSATPIVAGAVALVSSIAKAKGRLITPVEIRAALRATGTPQDVNTRDKRIGNLPDVQAMLTYLNL